MKKILFIIGTRPEAIKLAPVVIEMKKSLSLKPILCLTGQHREMIKQVTDFFELEFEYNIDVMTNNQSLSNLSSLLLTKIELVITEVEPDYIMVQGDTTTSMIGALSGFYKGVKIIHVEAGLRSFNNRSPFPEEINRKITGQMADIHFTPTLESSENLLNENVPKGKIHLVGNTVVDALLHGKEKIKRASWEDALPSLEPIGPHKKIILVTGHRRENFGTPLQNICSALLTLSEIKDVEIIYPVHLNPNVKNIVYELISGIENIHLIEPVNYASMIFLMSKSYIILTDSGGIQEEAPTLKKPVLIMREVTERMEGVNAGMAKLVGTNPEMIIKYAKKLIESKNYYKQMTIGDNPYGDGKSSSRIVKVLESI